MAERLRIVAQEVRAEYSEQSRLETWVEPRPQWELQMRKERGRRRFLLPGATLPLQSQAAPAAEFAEVASAAAAAAAAVAGA